MTTLRIDLDGPDPIHVAIARGVRRSVGDGSIGPGESLPAARSLAEALGVNVNTVLRAYRALRDEGLIDLRRGRGATVRSGRVDRARLHELTDALLAESTRLGLGTDDLHRLLEERR